VITIAKKKEPKGFWAGFWSVLGDICEIIFGILEIIFLFLKK